MTHRVKHNKGVRIESETGKDSSPHGEKAAQAVRTLSR